jgi:vacuolar-type H+-ATPase subunit E/Vma4
MVGEAESTARTTSMHKLNAARLQAKKEVAAVKGRAIDTVFSEAREKLQSIRSEGSYEKLFEQLLEEALAGVDTELVVHVDPRDDELARRLMATRDGQVEADIETVGGVVVSTKDGRIERRNTLEDRLDKLRHLARGQIAEILLA